MSSSFTHSFAGGDGRAPINARTEYWPSYLGGRVAGPTP